MEQILTELAGYGVLGVVGGYLFVTFMKERKEDRELFRKSVETFTDTSKTYAETIGSLTVRVENVEGVAERTESKVDKLLEIQKTLNC